MKKVVAISMGFYQGARVRPGTEFEVPDNFKGSWVAEVGSPASAPAKPKPARAEPKTLSEMAKVPAKSANDIV
jgi:hypothetical protein